MINPILQRPKAIFLMGPTASGKTTFAMELYQRLPVKIISVDSALIYRGMDIGTAKPSADELVQAPHRLIDICDPAESYSAMDFRQDAMREMEKITSSHHIPLLVGGTMFYFKVLLNGLTSLPPANPNIRMKIKHEAEEVGWMTLYKKLQEIDLISANRIHPNDLQRLIRALEVFFISGKTLTELTQVSCVLPLTYEVHQFAILPFNHSFLHERIKFRFYQMLAAGFEKEVSKLFIRGDLNKDMPSIRCVGYRQMWSYLSDEINYNDMVSRGIYATKQLAKHQITWLRKWQHNVHWLNSNQLNVALDDLLQVLSA